jgi:hypothetical protein
MKWATIGGSDYDALNAQLLKTNAEALRGAMHLFSTTAQNLAKASAAAAVVVSTSKAT